MIQISGIRRRTASPFPGFRIWLLCFVAIAPIFSHAQSENVKLLKAGGFIYYRNSSFSAFSFNLDSERQFRKSKSLSHGFRIDFLSAPPKPKYYFFGYQSLAVGYQFRVYPFYFKKKQGLKGFFTGLYPCYHVNIDKRYRSGPAAGLLIGYQFVFKKISLSYEFSPVYMQNVNPDIPPRNPRDRYFLLFNTLKLGIKY